MPVLLLPEDLFERDVIFQGGGIGDVFKGLIGKLRAFVPTKEGIRFFTGNLSLGAIADKVLPLLQPILNQAIEKGLPLLTEGALQALGSFGSQAAQASLRRIAIPGSKVLSKALIRRLEQRVQTGVKRRKARKRKKPMMIEFPKKVEGGRLDIVRRQQPRRPRGPKKQEFPGFRTGPVLNPRNLQFLKQR